MRIILLISFFALFTFSTLAQENEVVTVVGDSLVGKVVNGENLREVIGNVVMTQGDLKINCQKAIQYLAKNEAKLIGNVVVTQDTLKLKTEEGYYYSDKKIAVSDTNIYLSQPNMFLSADKGKYFFDDKKAEFYNNVHLKDSLFSLASDTLYYFKKDEKLIAVHNIKVSDTTSVIYADSLVHFRDTKTTFAYYDIKVDNFTNNIAIYGDTLISKANKNYSKITGQPLFRQIDTSSTGKLDTLFIASKMMESYSDSSKKFIATDSVKIIRGEFASVNEKSILKRADNIIETFKDENSTNQPVLWYQNSQLTGDSVFIYLNDNRLDWIDINGNGIIISENKKYDYRYDQISGDKIKLFFNDSTIQETEIYGNLLSIYYLFENNKPNGLIKSSSENGKIIFDDGKVVDVRLYKNPMSEYHPENLVRDKEKEFTLPLFNLYKNRPKKADLMKLIRE